MALEVGITAQSAATVFIMLLGLVSLDPLPPVQEDAYLFISREPFQQMLP